MARELWPQGIHVAHVVIDGIIGDGVRPTGRNSAPAWIGDIMRHLAAKALNLKTALPESPQSDRFQA
jgi:NAD(P)H-hydrate repair Nnr-like enzyme with NAD(P)H-hydrate epimerase domain